MMVSCSPSDQVSGLPVPLMINFLRVAARSMSLTFIFLIENRILYCIFAMSLSELKTEIGYSD